MGNYKDNKQPKRATNTFVNTASFPTTNISPGTKAIDAENDIIYYWSGTGWYKLPTETAVIRTYVLESDVTVALERTNFGIKIVTTNVAEGTLVPYTIYYNTVTASGTTRSGEASANFTIGADGSSSFVLFTADSYSPTDISKEFVLESANRSITIPIDKSTVTSGTFAYGEQLWSDGTTGVWTVPDGVTSISVVALGGGGAGREKAGGDVGGGGGALAYSNNITVTPGEALDFYTTPDGSFLGSASQTTNARSRLQRNGVDLVSAEPGMIYEVANSLGATGTGGRASASIGDVTYDGGDGRDGGFGAYGGSAAGWTGTNTVSNSVYSSGRGGYGTGPFGSSSNGNPGYTLTPPTNSNTGGSFGGGGGGLSPNAFPGDSSNGYGFGGGGFVRVIYPGDKRQFPNTEANKRTPRTFTMSCPTEAVSNTTFTVEVLVDNLIPGITFDVSVTGLPGGTLTQSYVQPSITEFNKTVRLNFTIPLISSDVPIGIEFYLDPSLANPPEITLSATAVVSNWSVSVSNITSDNTTKSTANEETLPSGVAINDDGSKIFIVGDNRNNIYQYNLFTPYDVSSATGTPAFYSVGNETGNPQDLVFNNNGTRMFVIGDNSTQGPSVFQYNLTSPYDIQSGVTYSNVSKVISSTDLLPTCLTFNNNGTKMYVAGVQNLRIDEYLLSQSFNINTAALSGNSYQLDISPTSISFDSNGRKMYVLERGSDSIFQYTLTTPFDLSTAESDNLNFVTNSNSQPEGMCFSSNGEKLYVVDLSSRTIYQYSTGVGISEEITYLLVGGGGGTGIGFGGRPGAGAGGVLTGTTLLQYNVAYPIIVGAGGTPTFNGEDTIAFDLTAVGGGGSEVKNGGSGHGSGTPYSSGEVEPPGTGIDGQGYRGGISRAESNGNLHTGSGGGGAGGPGESITSFTGRGGNGGLGVNVSSIFGTEVGDSGWFASGGAAGIYSGTPGVASAGGGGNGTTGSDVNNGQPKTGGGGGGAGQSGFPGSSGGSGVVLVKIDSSITVETTGTVNTFTVGASTVYEFESNGTITITL